MALTSPDFARCYVRAFINFRRVVMRAGGRGEIALLQLRRATVWCPDDGWV